MSLLSPSTLQNNKDYFDQSLDEIKLLKYVNSMDPDDEQGVVRLYDYFYHKVSGGRSRMHPHHGRLSRRVVVNHSVNNYTGNQCWPLLPNPESCPLPHPPGASVPGL